MEDSSSMLSFKVVLTCLVNLAEDEHFDIQAVFHISQTMVGGAPLQERSH